MKHALLAASAALLFLSACTSNNKPGTDGGTPDAGPVDAGSGVSAEQAATAYATFQCTAMGCVFGLSPDFCVSNPSPDMGIFSDGSFDVALSVSEGRTRYDDVIGAACVAALQSLEGLSCYGETSPLFAAAEALTVDGGTGPCDGMFTGAVLNGDECYDTKECATGYCDFAAGTCPGTCAPRRGTGVTCDSSIQCQVGSECVTDSPRTCQPKVILQQGAICNTSSECADGLYCDDTHTCTSAKVANGEPCVADAQCPVESTCAKASPFDNLGLCKAKVGAGADCGSGGFFFFPFSGECKGVQVCAGLVLDGGSVEQPGKCQAPGALGATCFPNSNELGGNGCFMDFACDAASSKCVLPPAAGSACIEGRCAQGAYCNASNQCAAKKADGASCDSNSECLHDCDTSNSPGTCYTPPDTTCAP